MRNVLQILALILMLQYIWGCDANLSSEIQQEMKPGISDAKEYFENNAVDLQDIDFVISAGLSNTRSKSTTQSIIQPLWKKTKIFCSERFTIYELPVSGDIKAFSLITNYRDSLEVSQINQVVTKLVMKQNNTSGEYICYMATMIGKNEDPKTKMIDYTHNKSFSGFIFISTLEGQCVDVYKCQAGVRQRIGLNFTRKSSLNSKEASQKGTTIQLYKPSAMSYSNGECIAEICYRCVDYGVPCEECDFCYQYLEEVIVTPKCEICGREKSNCVCCSVCKEYPCICYVDYACRYCGRYYCDGECRNYCAYCGARDCNGSCQGGGGGGWYPPEENKDKCDDARCSRCGKCKNPTRSDCSRCTCCTHQICNSCGKPIRPGNGIATRVAYSCSHAESEYCSSSGPICACGERHVDPVSKYPQCMTLTGMLLDNSGNIAYSEMWNWSVANSKECSALILDNRKLLVYFYAKNSFRSSKVCDVAKCKNGGKEYCFPADPSLSIGSDENIFDYVVTNAVHTHPSVDVRFDNIVNNQIKAGDLAVSSQDITLLSNLGLSCALILSKKSSGGKGYVFSFDRGAQDRNTYCPIVDDFD